MKFLSLFIGLVAASPAIVRNVLEAVFPQNANCSQLPRQILGNKMSLACQHDHLGLMKSQCRAGGGGGKGLGGGLGKMGKLGKLGS
jgi:hypothetical protein